MSPRTFGFLGTAFTVASSDEGALQWLGEFLCPWFESPARRGDLEVHVRHTLEAGTARARPEGAPESLPFVRLDSRIVHLPAWRRGREIILHDARLGCRYALGAGDPGGRENGAAGLTGCPGAPAVKVIVHAADARRRLGLMRLIREIALEHERQRTGPIELHAAAFESDGGAVVIAGPKLSGKTTLLLHTVARGRAHLVANDHVLVHLADGLADGRPGVTGVPSVISVRPATAAAFPLLCSRVARVGHPAQLTVEEADLALGELGPVGGADRLRFSAAQMARALPASLSAGAPLRALVFVETGAAAGAPRLVHLSTAEALGRLRASLYGGQPGRGERTVVAEMIGAVRARADAGHAPPAAADLLERIVSAVPSFGLAPGADAGSAVDLLWREGL